MQAQADTRRFICRVCFAAEFRGIIIMVKITFKLASGSKFDMDVEGSMTVATLKDLIADLANVAAPNQRMVFKGQVRHESFLYRHQLFMYSKSHSYRRCSKTPTLLTAAAWPTATSSTSSQCQHQLAKPLPLLRLLPPHSPRHPRYHNPQAPSRRCLRACRMLSSTLFDQRM